jgi:hypothetical protein
MHHFLGANKAELQNMQRKSVVAIHFLQRKNVVMEHF